METTIFTFFIMILLFKFNSRLAIENLALRQQLAIMRQSIHRPKIRKRDRLFWVILSRLWHDWKNVLVIVQPETVIRWHRKGFKLYWTFKSKKPGSGRPPTDKKVQKLIEKLIKENPLWGAPILHGELLKLGIEISERTVSNMIRKYNLGKPPSQTWRTFLNNHMHNTYAIDFFTVPTVNFKVLYVFVVLWHERRKILHFNVTTYERQVQFEPENGILIALPRVGGLHHRYEWRDAA